VSVPRRRGRPTVVLAALVAAVPSLAVRGAAAQRLAPRPELRVDGTFGRQAAVLAGAGLAVDAGRAARVALLGSGGAGRVGGRWQPAAEAQLVGRFLLDPFRQAPRGVYLGAGVAARVARRDAPRWLLVGVVGVEPPARGPLVPAVEVGLGGGVRAAVVLRRLRRDAR
jgi:hypothetical protein